MMAESKDVLFNYRWALLLIAAKTGFSGTARFSTDDMQYLDFFCSKSNKEQPMTENCLIITSALLKYIRT